MILCVRTDQPQAELALYSVSGQSLANLHWQGHRQLAETLHSKITELLMQHDSTLRQLTGIVAYKGPGSFTGLRIGLSVANALADSLGCPIVGTTTDAWQELGVARLLAQQSDTVVLPEYGAPVFVTQPRK